MNQPNTILQYGRAYHIQVETEKHDIVLKIATNDQETVMQMLKIFLPIFPGEYIVTYGIGEAWADHADFLKKDRVKNVLNRIERGLML